MINCPYCHWMINCPYCHGMINCPYCHWRSILESRPYLGGCTCEQVDLDLDAWKEELKQNG